MKHVVIVHGWKAKPETNWKPWLKRELEATGKCSVDVPAMPDSEHPMAAAWTKKLAETVGMPTPDTYLVGHSLGCITILRYLETLQGDDKIGGVVLVAGFGRKFPAYQGQHDDFLDHELDWERIRAHCSQFVAIHSDNDPHIWLDQMELFVQHLGAKGVVLHNMGHFASADGVFELPAARDAVLTMLKS